MPETELIPVYGPIDQMTILLFDPSADLAGPLVIEEPLGILGVAGHCFVQSRANILFRKIEVFPILFERAAERQPRRRPTFGPDRGSTS